ncbi:MAG: carbon-nitrogen hydrolase family protein [Bacteroidota bacterium]
MNDSLPKPFTAAVIQAAPVFFDKRATLDKMVGLIREAAAKEKASLILFPEVFIPGYPRGFLFGARVGGRTEAGRELFLRYWENSITVPGPETEMIGKAAKEAGAWVVAGVTEKDRISDTLYCTMVYWNPEGQLVGKHRKLKPTASERIIWGEGDGTDLGVFDIELGRIGGLICWENYMPLARTALYHQGIELYLAPTADCRDTWQSTLQHIACEGRCFVFGCNQYLMPEHYPAELRDLLPADHVPSTGGSAIISPMGKPLAGPLFHAEGILTATIDHREIIKAKMDFDPVGHYARNDVFRFEWEKNSD